MANIIKIKRGLKVNLPNADSSTFGELRYTTDTNELFIDNGTENKLINKDYIDNAISTHTTNYENPHQVTKAQVGLGNCDNTSDLNKPISTATQTALDTKVDKTNTANQVYITNSNSVQTTLTYGTTASTNYIVQRDSNSQITVPLVPIENNHVTSKKYVDDINADIQLELDTKVDKTNSIKRIYATDDSGAQTTISYSQSQNASYLVQRDSNAQVPVPEIPVADENAASKKYVDSGLALKPDTTSLDDVAFSGSYNDLVDVPTYKTINSEYITGTGNIPLQTPLSGTNGNVVIYTSTTGTLGELGFDNAPTQNSNKLVKSGPIWTELEKKINYTDIVNNLTTVDTNKPLSAYQGKVLDEKITLAQQSTHDRGVTLNALTSQGTNYTITAASINNAGTNYTVGDTLFLTSDMAIDAIINVLTVNSSGAITSISLGQGGAFTTAPTSPSSAFIGGTGSGATFTLTTSQVNNSTLSSIVNPQPNDFVTVLKDELHNDLRYVWKYADIDGDGTYEWVSGYPITNIERNFYNDPIQNGELDTNAVTTTKIANKNVTEAKIDDNAIIARHITAGTITDTHVASGAAIQQSKIANLTTDLASKVSKTSTAYQLYGTAGANTETTITYKTDNTASTIAQRDANSQLNVALTPTVNTNATSKKYVNDQDALKVDKVSGSKRVYGTDANGNQTTYDYDSFGKVDDVKVGTTSVLVNKIATLGTMAGESKDDYTKTANLAPVALSNDYEDLDNLPLIIQSNWIQNDSTKIDYILNKPDLKTVATTGSYTDLINKPVITNNVTQGSTDLLTSGGAFSNLVSSVTSGSNANEIIVTENGTNTTLTVDNVANATTASKLGSTTVGGITTPIYLYNGTATALSYTIAKSVPADAKFTDTTYSVFTGANGSTAGTTGLVKAPAASDNTKFLRGDCTWAVVDAFPSQSGNAGKFLTTNGSTVAWENVDAFPTQTGNAGKFLMTNGTTVSWEEISAFTAAEVETIWSNITPA